MANNDKPVDDVKPVKKPKKDEGVKAEEPEVTEEPASSPAAPADKGATPAGTDQSGRQLDNVICATCGKQTEVRFKQSGDRPVYCRDCYMKQKG